MPRRICFCVGGNTKNPRAALPIALYTCGMNKPAAQTAKSNLLRQTLIVLAVTVLSFFAGGGYRWWNAPIEDILHPHHAQGDDLSTDIYSFIMTFVFCGGASGLAGACISALALYLIEKKNKH